MKKLLWATLLVLFCPIAISQCSSDEGVSCGGLTCNSGEVCEDGQCALALNITGNEEDSGCQNDTDCSENQSCTKAHSTPANTCIPQLNCEHDSDCQTGLSCDNNGHCS